MNPEWKRAVLETVFHTGILEPFEVAEAKMSDEQMAVRFAIEACWAKWDGKTDPEIIMGEQAFRRTEPETFRNEYLCMPTEAEPLTSANDFRRCYCREPNEQERKAIEQNRITQQVLGRLIRRPF